MEYLSALVTVTSIAIIMVISPGYRASIILAGFPSIILAGFPSIILAG